MGDIGAALARSSVAHASEVHHGCADGGGSAGRENDRVGTMGRAAQANRGDLDGKESPRSRFFVRTVNLDRRKVVCSLVTSRRVLQSRGAGISDPIGYCSRGDEPLRQPGYSRRLAQTRRIATSPGHPTHAHTAIGLARS